MISRTKLISAIAAATALGGATVATTSPAQAWCGYYGCGGYGYGDAALAAGIVGGLAVGAIAASAAHDAQVRRSYRNRRTAVARKPRVQQVQAAAQ